MVMLLASMLLSGCASPGGGATLRVDTRELVAPQNLPDEVSRMMAALGYERLSLYNPVTRRQETIVQLNGEYRMLYQVRDDQRFRVEVTIREADGHIGLHFHEAGQTNLSESAQDHYEKLRERVLFEFGRDNVRDDYPALAP